MAKDFYKNARAYDIAFQDRLFNVECDFLEWSLNEHSKVSKEHKTNKSFLEIASGPARHAREFAKRGWKSTALDLSPEMVEFAKREALKEGLKLDTIAADMSKFSTRKKFTVAATLMESISHLTTNEQMISHFKSVAKALVPGGVYVIEATHPMFFFPDDTANRWISREGKTKVEITFGLPSDKYNTVTQTWDITARMKIWEDKELVSHEEHISPIRWYLAQEMRALIELSGVFEKYWIYGSTYFIPGKPLDESPDSDAMVFVMRTKK